MVYEVVLGEFSLGTITAPDEIEKWVFGYLTKDGIDNFEEFPSLEECTQFALSLLPEAIRPFVTVEKGP